MLSCPICLESVFSNGFDHINLVCPPCGHIYHSDCLGEWLTGNRTCPKCRLTFGRNDIRRLYFDVSNEVPPSNADHFLLSEELKKKNELVEHLQTVMTSVSYESNMIRTRNKYLKEEVERQKVSQSILKEENNKLMISHEHLNYELHSKTKVLADMHSKLNSLKWVEELVNMSYGEAQFESMLKKSDSESLKVALYHFKRESRKLTDLCDSKDCIIRALNDENRDLVTKCRKLDSEMKRQEGVVNALKMAHIDALKASKREVGNSRASDNGNHTKKRKLDVSKRAQTQHVEFVNDHRRDNEEHDEPEPSTSSAFQTAERKKRKTKSLAPNHTVTSTKKVKPTYKIVSSRRTLQDLHDIHSNK